MIHTACVTEPGHEGVMIEVCVEALCIDRNPIHRDKIRALAAESDAKLFEYMVEHEARDPACVAIVQYGPYTDQDGLVHAKMAYIVVAVEESIKEGKDGVGAPGEPSDAHV